MIRIVLRFGCRSKCILDIQGYGEGGVCRNIFALNGLSEVYAGTTVVGGGKTISTSRGNLISSTFDAVGLLTGGSRVFGVDLDERGLRAIDNHGTHCRYVEFPVISDILRFSKSEVMAFGKEFNIVAMCAHDAN